MNYFDEIFKELNGEFKWRNNDNQADALVLYDNGYVVLFERTGRGDVLVGESHVDNIFVLPDEIIEILTTVGAIKCRDNGELITEMLDFI